VWTVPIGSAAGFQHCEHVTSPRDGRCRTPKAPSSAQRTSSKKPATQASCSWSYRWSDPCRKTSAASAATSSVPDVVLASGFSATRPRALNVLGDVGDRAGRGSGAHVVVRGARISAVGLETAAGRGATPVPCHCTTRTCDFEGAGGSATASTSSVRLWAQPILAGSCAAGRRQVAHGAGPGTAVRCERDGCGCIGMPTFLYRTVLCAGTVDRSSRT
jgi:hypothetical protein